MANDKVLTEAEVNEFLQKMNKKNDAMKTSMETLSDDMFNNFILLIKELWREIGIKDATIESLKKPLPKPEKAEKEKKE